MRWFTRYGVIYFVFVFSFLLFFILLITLNKVEKLSNKEPARSDVHDGTNTHPPKKIKQIEKSSGYNNETPDASYSCQPLHFIPNAEKRPVTALVSFPGSGNTWLRYLIQQVTGVHTGSQYVDDTLMSHGFPGEPVFNASVAVVKTHEPGPKTRSRFQKAVLLVRHVEPAIRALFNLYSQGHTGCATKEDYERDHGAYLKRFVEKNIKTWLVTNLDWINNFHGPLHIVFYDQLRNDLGPTLRSLVQFLDLPLNETALGCTVEHAEGLYHRKHCSNSFNIFTENMKKLIAIAENNVFKACENKIKSMKKIS